MRLLPLLALLLVAAPAAAQEGPATAYGDAQARELVRLARERRERVDTRITRYRTTARERISVHLGVMGIERLLFRRETAARIDWSRDTVRIELLGAREAQPFVGDRPRRPPPDLPTLLPSLAFDPVRSEMLLRVDSTDLRHPLAAGSEASYRFSSGDSTSIRLPDGRSVRLLELRVTARRPEPSLINGSLWLDAETHAVVRAVFRPARGFSTTAEGLSVLTPEVTGEVDYVAIDYGLWDFRWWLPRTVVARGVVRAMGARVPLAYERSYEAYQVEGDTSAPASPAAEAALAGAASALPCRPRAAGSIVIDAGDEDDAAVRDSAWEAAFERSSGRLAAGDTAGAEDGAEARPRCDRTFLVTRAEGVDLVSGPAFEGSVYDEGEGPVGEAELREIQRLLRALPESPWGIGRPRVRLLSPDLLRLNRVEGVSVGAAASLPLGPAELRGELHAGTTGEVGARLAALRSGIALRAEAAAYRGLEAVEVSSRPFSFTSSASVLLLGRDDNDYFRATGAELRLGPPEARRQWWDLRLFAERQESVRARSAPSFRGLLDDDFAFRDNLEAERLDQAGASLRLRAGLGEDPARIRARAELELLGETGERTFARPLLRLGGDGPLFGGLGFGASLAAGTALGDPSLQRAWQIGGVGSVRGHDPAAQHGGTLWLARGELTLGPPLYRLSLFGDAGWAGDRDAVASARPLRGLGIGASLLGGLLRLDLARGLDGGGTRLYLRVGTSF